MTKRRERESAICRDKKKNTFILPNTWGQYFSLRIYDLLTAFSLLTVAQKFILGSKFPSAEFTINYTRSNLVCLMCLSSCQNKSSIKLHDKVCYCQVVISQIRISSFYN